jgi:hypothetical protein
VDPASVTLAWPDILKLTLGTGFVTSALNHFAGSYLEGRKERRSVRRDSRYLAIRLAVILERFAIDCADIIAENNSFLTPNGFLGRRDSQLPTLQEYPSDIDWRSFEPELSVRIFSLPNEVSVSQGVISFADRLAGGPDGSPSDTTNQAGLCGHRALHIANDLRERYQLPPFRMAWPQWDVPTILKEAHDKALE